MSQSGFIAALLLAAFILFLAAQNRLVTYANVLWGNTSKPIPQPPKNTGAAPGPGGLGDVAGTVGAGLLGTGGGIGGLLGGVGDLLEGAAPLLLAP